MVESYKEHQRFLVLNIVNHKGSVSRTELAELTGYQLASISAITKQLIEDKLLVECGSYSTGYGRKRTLLELNKQHLCAVSISFSSTAVTFSVVQFDGTVIGMHGIPVNSQTTEAELIEQSKLLLQKILEDYQQKEIAGIGMCAPANDQIGSHYFAFCPDHLRFSNWLQQVLLPELRASSPVRVNLFLDATLAIWAEREYGLAKGVQDFMCIELSNRISCSICSNGKAVTGTSYFAGELGHTVISADQADGTLCYCGKPGCVESAFSLPQLLDSIHKALSHNVTSTLCQSYKHNGSVSVADIRQAVEDGDQMCRYYVKKCADHLGIAIANAAMLLNPKLIILYGSMLELGDYFVNQLKEAIFYNTLKKIRDNYSIVTSPNLEKMMPLGAISGMFSFYLKTDDFDWVYRLPAVNREVNT